MPAQGKAGFELFLVPATSQIPHTTQNMPALTHHEQECCHHGHSYRSRCSLCFCLGIYFVTDDFFRFFLLLLPSRIDFRSPSRPPPCPLRKAANARAALLAVIRPQAVHT